MRPISENNFKFPWQKTDVPQAKPRVTTPYKVMDKSLERSPQAGDVTDFEHAQLEEFYKSFAGKKLVDSLQNAITPENLLGCGHQFRVYSLGDYVLRVPARAKAFSVSFENLIPTKDEFDGRNFGQPIASNIYGVEIAKKVEGKPLYSDFEKPWIDYMWNEDQIGKKESDKYFEQLQEVAQFPQETLAGYTEDVKTLADKKYEIDPVNPNNFLHDKKGGRLNIIDVSRSFFNAWANSVTATRPLVDYDRLGRYYEFLSPENREKTLKMVTGLFSKMDAIGTRLGIITGMPPELHKINANKKIDFQCPNFKALFSSK